MSEFTLERANILTLPNKALRFIPGLIMAWNRWV